MLKTIIKKEILENILSYRFPLFFLICLVLIPLGLYVNYNDYSKRMSDYHEQVRLNREDISKSTMWDIMSGNVPFRGFRPPSPLSVFAQGFENSLPKFYEFKRGGYIQGETAIGDESILSIHGKLDFVFIIQMVISLIVFLFASDVIAGEKELGTLRGILSNSLPRHALLIGKLLGGYLALWIPFFIAFLVGVLFLGLHAFPVFETNLLSRIGILFFLATFFMLAYYIIGVLISASCARTRTALVVILLVWIFFQLIVPRLSDMIARMVFPIRTETVVSMQKSLAKKSLDEEQARILGKKYEALFGSHSIPRNPEPSPELEAWNKFKQEVEQDFQIRRLKQLNEIEEAYRREKWIQQAIAGNVSVISPGAAFARFFTDVCGTGESDKQNYLRAVKAYQQILESEVYSYIKQTTLIFPGGATASSSTIEGSLDLKSLPGFSIKRSSLAEVCKQNVRSFISLLFWWIAPFVLAYVRFLRYDVR